MPYVGVTRSERLTLPSNDSYWVDMKVKATYGDRLAGQKAMLKISRVDLASLQPHQLPMVQADPESGTGMLTEIEIDAYMRTLLVRLITDWNVDGEDGVVLPIDVDSLSLLDGDDGDFLMAEARKRMAKRPAADERPFDGRSKQQLQGSKSAIQKRSGH